MAHIRLLTTSILFSAGCTSGWTSTSTAPSPQPQPVVTRESFARAPFQASNFRVVEAATGNTVSFATLVGRAAQAEVIFFGEQHDDPETHFLELALLDGLRNRHAQVVLSLEMFERDVQPELDRYLGGAVSESVFLAMARPWPRYATDYRPMVQLARARGWRVVAANIPRPMASAIARRGMRALDTLTAAERARAAAAMVCPTDDAYFMRFAQAMGGHSAGGGPPTAIDSAAAHATTVRYYEAQCAKDETMAESIARELTLLQGRGVLLHVNGAFHSDYGQGTAERVRRRVPGVRTLLVTAVPVDNPGSAVVGTHAGKADFVIFTRK